MKDYNDFWEKMSSSHGEHPSVRFRNHLILRTVKGVLDPIGDNAILDVGCGDGVLLRRLHGYLSSSKNNVIFSGYDVSESQIKKNKLNSAGFNFQVADFNYEVASDDKFQIIICSEVIEHLEKWRLALQSISRMNNPGGYLILTTQSGKRFKSDCALGHLQHFELDELTDYLKTLDYVIIKGEKYGFPFYNLQKMVNSVFFSMSDKVRHNKGNFFNSILFQATYFLFRLSLKSKKLGPQIFILARKIS